MMKKVFVVFIVLTLTSGCVNSAQGNEKPKVRGTDKSCVDDPNHYIDRDFLDMLVYKDLDSDESLLNDPYIVLNNPQFGEEILTGQQWCDLKLSREEQEAMGGCAATLRKTAMTCPEPAVEPIEDISEYIIDMKDIPEDVKIMNGHTDIVERFVDLNDLIKNTRFIIRGEVKEVYQIIWGELPFTIVEVNVKEILKGDGPKTIFVIETGGYYHAEIKDDETGEWKRTEEPVFMTMTGHLMQKDDEVLLFMNEFDGPQEEYFGREMYSTFVGQGKFFIESNTATKATTYVWKDEITWNDTVLTKKIKERVKDLLDN